MEIKYEPEDPQIAERYCNFCHERITDHLYPETYRRATPYLIYTPGTLKINYNNKDNNYAVACFDCAMRLCTGLPESVVKDWTVTHISRWDWLRREVGKDDYVSEIDKCWPGKEPTEFRKSY